jgi:hypothetical protein
VACELSWCGAQANSVSCDGPIDVGCRSNLVLIYCDGVQGRLMPRFLAVAHKLNSDRNITHVACKRNDWTVAPADSFEF